MTDSFINREADGSLAQLSLGALGVVYGDIGTSPLYAFRLSFFTAGPIEVTEAHILGVLSLIVWSLVIVISLKYLLVVMRADNDGEGGIIALVSLFHPERAGPGTARFVLIAAGMFGAALLYGDGTITPAISVLSALEGLELEAPALSAYVIPLTLVVLVGLFRFQRRGSSAIGRLFGPFMLTWFCTIGLLGLLSIVQAPTVLRAMNPGWAINFLFTNGYVGFLVLGTVFLAVTGGETLYADMGHFGKKPIRLAWFALVLPCLLLSYFGQGALVLGDVEQVRHPFFGMAPAWAHYPLVGLATIAAIIASQAVISGVFSLTRQAINLNMLPRLRLVQTSPETLGQIYVPLINTALLIVSVVLVLTFRSSGGLASAYGVAIATDMVITTALVMTLLWHWGWPRPVVILLGAIFLPVDLAFLGSNLIKIASGGWYPLVLGGVIFFLMATWARGSSLQSEQISARRTSLEEFLSQLDTLPVSRPIGTTIFVARPGQHRTPAALVHLVDRLSALQQTVLIVALDVRPVPHIPASERIRLEKLAPGIHCLTAAYGFMQHINIPALVKLAELDGLILDSEPRTYVVSREIVFPTTRGGMWHWRERLYGVMYRNQDQQTAHWGIPAEEVLEVGIRVEI